MVILACVGACGLVIACLMGWLDRGAYALLIAPLRPALRRSPLNSFTPLWQVTCGYDPPANSAACCRGLAGPGKRSRSTMTPKSCASRLDLHDCRGRPRASLAVWTWPKPACQSVHPSSRAALTGTWAMSAILVQRSSTATEATVFAAVLHPRCRKVTG